MITSDTQASTPNEPTQRRYTEGLTRALATKNGVLVMLAVCVMLAAGLRLFNLGAQSFWYDEGETLGYAANLFPIRGDHPPTYYALIHLVLSLSASEFWVRFPSFLMGIASVVMLYFVGRLLFSANVTLVATLLASVSPFLIWHSQDARMYSQFLLGCLLTIYFYVRILQRGKTSDWLGYLFAALFSAYTHLFAALLVVTLSCHILLFHRQKLLKWITFQFFVLIGYAPWLIVLVALPHEKIGGLRPKTLVTFPYTYFAFINGYSLGPSLLELRDFNIGVLVPYLPLLIPIGLVIAVLGSAGIWKLWRSNRDLCGLLSLWAVLPVFIAVLIPIFVRTMTFNVRYVIFSVPAVLFILASGVLSLKKYQLGVILLVIMVMYNALSLYNNYFNDRYAKEDVRGAVAYLNSNIAPDDHILTITVGRLVRWYFHQDNLVVSNLSDQPAEAFVNSAATDAHTVWLVESRPWQTDPNNEIRKVLDSQYSLIDKIDFSGVSLYRYCIRDCSPA